MSWASPTPPSRRPGRTESAAGAAERRPRRRRTASRGAPQTGCQRRWRPHPTPICRAGIPDASSPYCSCSLLFFSIAPQHCRCLKGVKWIINEYIMIGSQTDVPFQGPGQRWTPFRCWTSCGRRRSRCPRRRRRLRRRPRPFRGRIFSLERRDAAD